jgi:hypothetical protein
MKLSSPFDIANEILDFAWRAKTPAEAAGRLYYSALAVRRITGNKVNADLMAALLGYNITMKYRGGYELQQIKDLLRRGCIEPNPGPYTRDQIKKKIQNYAKPLVPTGLT